MQTLSSNTPRSNLQAMQRHKLLDTAPSGINLHLDAAAQAVGLHCSVRRNAQAAAAARAPLEPSSIRPRQHPRLSTPALCAC